MGTVFYLGVNIPGFTLFAPCWRSLPTLLLLDAEHAARTLLRSLRSNSITLMMGPWSISLTHIRTVMKHIGGWDKMLGIRMLDLQPLKASQNRDAVARVFQLPLAERLRREVPGAAGTATVIYAFALLHSPYSLTPHSTDVRVLIHDVWLGYTLLKVWRFYVSQVAVLSSTRATRGNFLYRQAWDAAELLAYSFVHLALAMGIFYPGGVISPRAASTLRLESLFSAVRAGAGGHADVNFTTLEFFQRLRWMTAAARAEATLEEHGVKIARHHKFQSSFSTKLGYFEFPRLSPDDVASLLLAAEADAHSKMREWHPHIHAELVGKHCWPIPCTQPFSPVPPERLCAGPIPHTCNSPTAYGLPRVSTLRGLSLLILCPFEILRTFTIWFGYTPAHPLFLLILRILLPHSDSEVDCSHCSAYQAPPPPPAAPGPAPSLLAGLPASAAVGICMKHFGVLSAAESLQASLSPASVVPQSPTVELEEPSPEVPPTDDSDRTHDGSSDSTCEDADPTEAELKVLSARHECNPVSDTATFRVKLATSYQVWVERPSRARRWRYAKGDLTLFEVLRPGELRAGSVIVLRFIFARPATCMARVLGVFIDNQEVPKSTLTSENSTAVLDIFVPDDQFLPAADDRRSGTQSRWIWQQATLRVAYSCFASEVRTLALTVSIPVTVNWGLTRHFRHRRSFLLTSFVTTVTLPLLSRHCTHMLRHRLQMWMRRQPGAQLRLHYLHPRPILNLLSLGKPDRLGAVRPTNVSQRRGGHDGHSMMITTMMTMIKTSSRAMRRRTMTMGLKTPELSRRGHELQAPSTKFRRLTLSVVP